jgi:hypothetical protein
VREEKKIAEKKRKRDKTSVATSTATSATEVIHSVTDYVTKKNILAKYKT